MNEEMKYLAEELEDFLRKGHKVLNKLQQNMGQRSGYVNRNMGNDGFNPWENGAMGQRTWQGYDPRFM